MFIDSANLIKVLAEDKVLTSDQVSLIKIEQANSGRDAETIISEHGFATSEELTKAKAKILGIPFVAISTTSVSPDVLTFIPEPVARRYNLLPFAINKKDGSLLVAMEDPLDLQVLEFIEKKSGKAVKPYMAVPEN